jgi:hypothetical protein
MIERTLVIPDASHQKDAKGTAYLWLRVSGPVAEVFRKAQLHLREVVGEGRASWPEAHLTLKTFGATDRQVDAPIEGELVSLTEAWSHVTPPLRLEVEAMDVLVESKTPMLRIATTPELTAALQDIRARADAIGVASYEDGVSPEYWIHHLSLAYYVGKCWGEVEALTRGLALPAASYVATQAELVAFDGGPERLLVRLSAARLSAFSSHEHLSDCPVEQPEISEGPGVPDVEELTLAR